MFLSGLACRTIARAPSTANMTNFWCFTIIATSIPRRNQGIQSHVRACGGDSSLRSTAQFPSHMARYSGTTCCLARHSLHQPCHRYGEKESDVSCIPEVSAIDFSPLRSLSSMFYCKPTILEDNNFLGTNTVFQFTHFTSRAFACTW
jgi:hypothetical protein